MTPFVDFEHVSYRAPDGRPILSDVSLSVACGETLALIGRSGSGKTTALTLANALALPTGGRVVVDGRDTRDWDAIRLRRRTGWVIQEIGLFPHLSVGDNVGIVPALEGWDVERRRARVDELLALVGLAPDAYRARRPGALSGGERQRVGVARALAAGPPLVLLDEPFGALDPITRCELQAEFRRLQRLLGTTAIFVTHDLVEATRVGDRLALLAEGAVVASGTLDDLRAAAHPEARRFLEAGGLA